MTLPDDRPTFEPLPTSRRFTSSPQLAIGLSIGVGIGLVFGLLVLGNPVFGLSLGILVGAGIGFALYTRHQRQVPDNQGDRP